MQAIELQAQITASHEIHLQLPTTINKRNILGDDAPNNYNNHLTNKNKQVSLGDDTKNNYNTHLTNKNKQASLGGNNTNLPVL